MKILISCGLTMAVTLAAFARADDRPTGQVDKEKNAERPEPFNVKHQLYTRYVAGGQLDERSGLWGPSNNFPHSIKADDKFGERGELSVVATLDGSVRLGKAEGIRLRVVNRSNDRQTLSAIDSHLYIVQEALDEKGEWKPIERIPHGTGPRDCAVGFHRISLKPNEYWNLVGPRYSGSFKTKLRFRLDLGKNDGEFPKPGGKLIYSNEYEGSINPEQFQRGGVTAFDLNAR
jgi:hypothetical protein